MVSDAEGAPVNQPSNPGITCVLNSCKNKPGLSPGRGKHGKPQFGPWESEASAKRRQWAGKPGLARHDTFRAFAMTAGCQLLHRPGRQVATRSSPLQSP